MNTKETLYTYKNKDYTKVINRIDNAFYKSLKKFPNKKVEMFYSKGSEGWIGTIKITENEQFKD